MVAIAAFYVGERSTLGMGGVARTSQPECRAEPKTWYAIIISGRSGNRRLKGCIEKRKKSKHNLRPAFGVVQMPTYKIYLRSFAPWRRFGALFGGDSIPVPVFDYNPPNSMFDSGVSVGMAPLQFGGEFHGDGRGFSLETGSPRVTARYFGSADTQGLAGKSEAWCDESQGPWMEREESLLGRVCST
jgi:hypothetical protein